AVWRECQTPNRKLMAGQPVEFSAAGSLPHPDRGVLAACNHILPIRRKHDGRYVGRTREDTNLLAAGNIPEPNDLIAAAGEQIFAVRRERNIGGAGGDGDTAQLGSGSAIPDAGRAVQAGGRDRPAVWRKLDPNDPPAMSREDSDRLAGGDIPQPRGVVEAG